MHAEGSQLAHSVHHVPAMSPFVLVTFTRMQPQPSLEGAAHRWVARMETVGLSIQRAIVNLEQVDRKHTRVTVTVSLADAGAAQARSSHENPYVAIGNAFRALRHSAPEARRLPMSA